MVELDPFVGLYYVSDANHLFCTHDKIWCPCNIRQGWESFPRGRYSSMFWSADSSDPGCNSAFRFLLSVSLVRQLSYVILRDTLPTIAWTDWTATNGSLVERNILKVRPRAI